MQFKIDIFEKQVLNYKELFPENHNIQQYEARIYFFQGFMRQISGVHYDIYGGMFSPSLKGELKAALNLYDKSLQLNEHSKTRTMKVFCYRQLKDINSALRELNFIIKHYADDEEVYLAARKEKDELETRFKL
ncbi:MAG: hypothetical protein M5U34_26365 [Chloroflexi bacterium]|nr:hypothetical protein [Chloroflexota bacterium]